MAFQIIFNPFTGKFDYVNAPGVSIPEYTSDPVSPVAGDTWVLRSTPEPGGGAIGLLLALTYAGEGLEYELSYFTTENTIVRVDLI